MTHKFQISILTIIICLTNAIVSVGQGQTTNKIKIDTSKIAIIPFDEEAGYPFDNTFKKSTLTQYELQTIDNLLVACVKDYNNSLDKEHKQWIIDLKKYNYRKQLIVVTNKQGQKEVWINCFCTTFRSNNWKTEVMSVHDGGKCFFNFKVNLTTNKFYDLIVNGQA